MRALISVPETQGQRWRGDRSRRRPAIHTVAAHAVTLAWLTSLAVVAVGYFQAWPLWITAAAALIPWLPIFYDRVVWTHRHHSWLALFYVLVISQVGHFFEHVAQMIQIHLFGLPAQLALGIFGALNIEWVHFVFNTWVFGAATLMIYFFRANPWLRVAVVATVWHEIEHVFIMATYLSTGKAGTPGLLAAGGAIGGGLPLTRPDLHFLYNLVQTIPLVVAFAYQLKRSHVQWLRTGTEST